MSQPVWTLSVDLQTRTATFQSGMSDAAKSARGAFGDIKDGAREMGGTVGGHMSEARHGVMLLGEEFGIHLPRGITTFIASLGPVGAAMEAAFPFLAIIVGATLLIEHLAKVKEQQAKLTEDQGKFSTAIYNAFGALDAKIIEAEIKADELNHNHLGALKKQLELIDHQSMSELVHAFDEVSKAADQVFQDLKVHWYQTGQGSEGAKHALTEFKTQYDNLLAQGKDKEASDLLAGTLHSAQRVLELQHQYLGNLTQYGNGAFSSPTKTGNLDPAQLNQLKVALAKEGVGWTEKEVQAQQALVDVLQSQASIQERVANLKKLQDSNATRTTDDKITDENVKRTLAQFAEEKRGQEQANREWEENYRRAVAAIQQGEREKIDATDKGSAERLTAIDAAIKEENAKGLQETDFYRSLLTQRVQVTRDMAAEQSRVAAALGTEDANHTTKMGELKIAAEKEQAQLARSGRRVTDAEMMADALKTANDEFKIKSQGLAAELAALDKHGKDYEVKLKTLQDKQKELIQQHENEVTAIKDKAQENQNARTLAALTKLEDAFATGLTNVIMRHESFAKMIGSIGDQVASGMLKNALMSIMTLDMDKERQAAHAARDMYLAGAKFPFPMNIVMAPTLAAAGFAAMMAFETGGIVPGVGRGDIVPAMLTPGESVLPKDLTEGLQSAARGGTLGGVTHVHQHHHYSTFHIHAVDGASVRGMLSKHGSEFAKHFHNELRKMNR